jgi:hypothetical protein
MLGTRGSEQMTLKHKDEIGNVTSNLPQFFGNLHVLQPPGNTSQLNVLT